MEGKHLLIETISIFHYLCIYKKVQFLNVIAWSVKKVDFLHDSEMAEAFAVRVAATLARDMGFQNVLIEGDCLSIVHQL